MPPGYYLVCANRVPLRRESGSALGLLGPGTFPARKSLVRCLGLGLAAMAAGLTLSYWVFWSPEDSGGLFEESMLVIAHRGQWIGPGERAGGLPGGSGPRRERPLEMDVHLTRDGEVVVIHDGTVDRTTDGTGNVGDLTLAQLKALGSCSWLSRRFAGERIPTLQEVMDRAQNRVILEIEL